MSGLTNVSCPQICSPWYFFFGLEMIFLHWRKIREMTMDNIINKQSFEKRTSAFQSFGRNIIWRVKTMQAWIRESTYMIISTAKIQFLSENQHKSDTLVLLFSNPNRKVRNLHLSLIPQGRLAAPSAAQRFLTPDFHLMTCHCYMAVQINCSLSYSWNFCTRFGFAIARQWLEPLSCSLMSKIFSCIFSTEQNGNLLLGQQIREREREWESAAVCLVGSF